MRKKKKQPRSKPPTIKQLFKAWGAERLTKWLEHEDARSWVRVYRDIYQEKRDPIALTQAFTIAIQHGFYPPVSILKAVASHFQHVLDKEVSLDYVMGLKQQGRGNNWTAFTRAKREGFSYWLASTMYSLTTGCGCLIDEAARRLNGYLEHHPEHPQYTGIALRTSTGATNKCQDQTR